MVVAQLAKAGFITEVATTRAGQRPERTVYAITDAGRDELRDWLRGLLAEPVHEYPGFVSALSLIGAPHPDDVVGLLRSRLDRLSEQRAENQKLVDDALAGGLPDLFLIEEEYRIAQAETEETFVRRLIERIRDPPDRLGARLGPGPRRARRRHAAAVARLGGDPARHRVVARRSVSAECVYREVCLRTYNDLDHCMVGGDGSWSAGGVVVRLAGSGGRRTRPSSVRRRLIVCAATSRAEPCHGERLTTCRRAPAPDMHSDLVRQPWLSATGHTAPRRLWLDAEIRSNGVEPSASGTANADGVKQVKNNRLRRALILEPDTIDLSHRG